MQSVLHMQVGRHANVAQALSVALRTDGTRGLFRGTIPLLSREVPFYVVGMTGYAYLKNVFNGNFPPMTLPASFLLSAPELALQCNKASYATGGCQQMAATLIQLNMCFCCRPLCSAE